MKRWTGLWAVICALTVGLAGGAGCESDNPGDHCPTGYDDVDGDGTNCVDIDECAEGTDACHALATCINMAGSYACACPFGYQVVHGDVMGCVDIDECAEGSDNCDDLATCTNTTGAYTCSCPVGYDDVDGDGTSCVEINECAEDTDGCDEVATCVNTDGGYTCTCPVDYTDVHGDGTLCEPPACTAEGDSHAISPSALPCCPGLVDVGCDAPDSNGGCISCMGASYCTDCGDGICGPGENECRCPADCP